MKMQMCHYPGCSCVSESYYCERHAAKRKAEKEAQSHEIFKGTRRGKSASYNSLYHSPRWRRERREFLKAFPYCFLCGAKADTVDHIKPHRGDPELFWDQGNWQSLCRSCHSRKTLAENHHFSRKERQK